MTPERLKELIKQCEKVWSDSWNEVIQLNPSNCFIKQNLYNGKFYLSVEEDEEHCPSYYLDNLREDWERAKAEYEWKEKTTAERTERFEPPMWEDIKDEFVFKFLVNGCLFRFYVDKDFCDIFGQLDGDDCYLVSKPATKENYEKACEIVRELFNKGGAK